MFWPLMENIQYCLHKSITIICSILLIFSFQYFAASKIKCLSLNMCLIVVVQLMYVRSRATPGTFCGGREEVGGEVLGWRRNSKGLGGVGVRMQGKGWEKGLAMPGTIASVQ